MLGCPSTWLFESALWKAWKVLPNAEMKIVDWLLGSEQTERDIRKRREFFFVAFCMHGH